MSQVSEKAILAAFEAYSARMESERRIRQEVRVAAASLDTVSRTCLLRLRAAYRPGGLTDLAGVCAAARERLAPCRMALEHLAQLLPEPDLQFRHQHQWRSAAQRLCLAVSLLAFLERGRPATWAELAVELGFLAADGGSGDPRLRLGDHLQGLLALSTELARLSVNSVIADAPDLPARALECVTNIRRGFRLMPQAADLRSCGDPAAADALATAESRLAADLAKIEDVVYDLAVRGRRIRPALLVPQDA